MRQSLLISMVTAMDDHRHAPRRYRNGVELSEVFVTRAGAAHGSLDRRTPALRQAGARRRQLLLFLWATQSSRLADRRRWQFGWPPRRDAEGLLQGPGQGALSQPMADTFSGFAPACSQRLLGIVAGAPEQRCGLFDLAQAVGQLLLQHRDIDHVGAPLKSTLGSA